MTITTEELWGFINFIATLRPDAIWRPPEDPKDFADTKDLLMATTSILTPPGAASFLNLQKARPVVVGGEPRFSLTLIFDKAQQARPEFGALQRAIDAALKERWPGKLPTGLRSPFHDGAEKAGVYDGYKAGDVFISPWSKDKPGAVNARKEDIIDWTEFWAGWLVRANVRPFAYDQGGNKGCGLFLDSVQFLRPGKRLDGRKSRVRELPRRRGKRRNGLNPTPEPRAVRRPCPVSRRTRCCTTTTTMTPPSFFPRLKPAGSPSGSRL